MAKFKHHLFICSNRRPAEDKRGSCDPQGLASLQLKFKQALAARGLKSEIRANKAGCLDQCEHGPTVVVYPEGVWYGGVRESDVAEIVESHLMNGLRVKRLELEDECVNTSSCRHRRQE